MLTTNLISLLSVTNGGIVTSLLPTPPAASATPAARPDTKYRISNFYVGAGPFPSTSRCYFQIEMVDERGWLSTPGECWAGLTTYNWGPSLISIPSTTCSDGGHYEFSFSRYRAPPVDGYWLNVTDVFGGHAAEFYPQSLVQHVESIGDRDGWNITHRYGIEEPEHRIVRRELGQCRHG